MDEKSSRQIRVGTGMAYKEIWGISLSPGYNDGSFKRRRDGIPNAGHEWQ